ncbi:MAG: hypothetical protein D6767_04870, partial [Candidatus Hydrogenedentota bacterium]
MYFPDISWELLLKLLKWEKNFLPTLLTADEWVISFSGGADSVLTATLLYNLQKTFPATRKVTFFYLHHYGKKPMPKQRQQVFSFWQQAFLNLPQADFSFYEIKKDVALVAKKLSRSFEHTGSLLRHKEAEKLLRGKNALFFTGHTLTDWLETIFLRLQRGAGVQAIFPLDVREGKKVHPLYLLTRFEVRNFLKDNKIPYWDDPDNESVGHRALARKALAEIFWTNPEGMRRSALNFLEKKRKYKKEEIELFSKMQQVSKREYRIEEKKFQSLDAQAKEILSKKSFQKLGLFYFNTFLREKLSSDKMYHPPFFMEIENYNGLLY